MDQLVSKEASVQETSGSNPTWALLFLDDLKYVRCDINNLLMSHPVGAI